MLSVKRVLSIMQYSALGWHRVGPPHCVFVEWRKKAASVRYAKHRIENYLHLDSVTIYM
jgi:hypothetical protein